MENLIIETNARLQEIINNLTTIKTEYTNKLAANSAEIETQLKTVDRYREEFFTSKRKIEKMNADIEGFEEDYKKLVERFQDDELANILVAANKEISTKIEERKRKIIKDRQAMNDLVGKAEEVKEKLVKLTAEKKALELCLAKISDSHEFYTKSLNQIIEYSSDNQDNLCACFHVEDERNQKDKKKEELQKAIDSINIEPIEETEMEPIEDDEDNNSDIPNIFEDNTIGTLNEILEDKDDFETEVIVNEEDIKIEKEAIKPIKDTKKIEPKKDINVAIEVKKEVFNDDELNLDEIDELTIDSINDKKDNNNDKKDHNKKDKTKKENKQTEEEKVEVDLVKFEDMEFDEDLELDKLINFQDDLED